MSANSGLGKAIADVISFAKRRGTV